jgi:precorrin-8X/cobalt-precorrin-8 methylmutase
VSNPIEITAITDDGAFDAYVMVDWSSRSTPCDRQRLDLDGEPCLVGPNVHRRLPAKHLDAARAVEELRKRVVYWRDEGKRVLVGFDFAFGYPAGFASALGLASAGGV